MASTNEVMTSQKERRHASGGAVTAQNQPEIPNYFMPARMSGPGLLKLMPMNCYERPGKHRLFVMLALAIVIGYFAFLMALWAPAPGKPGIDENGYLVGGKMMARHLNMGFKPPSPFSYVGAMWVLAPNDTYYPKYPAGVPFLYAMMMWLGGSHGREWAFAVSPVCTSLAVLAMFLLTRHLSSSFLGLLAMIVLACGQTTLQLAEVPNSHAPALAFTLWGMYLLICWWTRGRIITGLTAGICLGYAVTIRYSEGLLLAPLLTAVLLTIRWKHWQSYCRAVLPLAGWAAPVLLLVLHNLLTMHTLTGYDTTHESTAFRWDEFVKKWEFTVQEMYMYGAFMIAPLGIAGLTLLFRSNWRAGLLLNLWFVPGALLYTSYYWGQQVPGVGYLRFFLTLFPPLIAAGFALLHEATGQPISTPLPQPGPGVPGDDEKSPGRPAYPSTPTLWLGTGQGEKTGGGSFAAPLAAGILTAIASISGLYVALPNLIRQHAANLNLAYSVRRVLQDIKGTPGTDGKEATPVVFADVNIFPQLLMDLQFMGDADWYAADSFQLKALWASFINKDEKTSAPSPLQLDRQKYLEDHYRGKTWKDLVQDQNRVMSNALAAGRNVYVVLTPFQADNFLNKYVAASFQYRKIDHWTEPEPMTAESVAPAARPSGQTAGLAPPTAQLPNWIFHWAPQTWDLYQISQAVAR